MTDTVTAKLAKWEALTSAATEGPWAVPHDHEEVYGDTCVTIGNYGWVACGPGGQGPAYDEDSDQGRADAEFIGHAREMVPALLGFVREVQHILATQRHEVIGARGVRKQDVVRARDIEQAARKWIGGEG